MASLRSGGAWGGRTSCCRLTVTVANGVAEAFAHGVFVAFIEKPGVGPDHTVIFALGCGGIFRPVGICEARLHLVDHRFDAGAAFWRLLDIRGRQARTQGLFSRKPFCAALHGPARGAANLRRRGNECWVVAWHRTAQEVGNSRLDILRFVDCHRLEIDLRLGQPFTGKVAGVGGMVTLLIGPKEQVERFRDPRVPVLGHCWISLR